MSFLFHFIGPFILVQSIVHEWSGSLFDWGGENTCGTVLLRRVSWIGWRAYHGVWFFWLAVWVGFSRFVKWARQCRDSLSSLLCAYCTARLESVPDGEALGRIGHFLLCCVGQSFLMPLKANHERRIAMGESLVLQLMTMTTLMVMVVVSCVVAFISSLLVHHCLSPP